MLAVPTRLPPRWRSSARSCAVAQQSRSARASSTCSRAAADRWPVCRRMSPAWARHAVADCVTPPWYRPSLLTYAVGVPGEELTMIAYCDLAGLVRGRSVPTASFEDRLRTGVGWVPANQAINCFGPLAEPNPWGSVGDRRLIPDPATRVQVDLWDDASPLDFVLSDATHTDGSPWDACPRTFLKAALDDLRAETGLRLAASFEHEFVLGGGSGGGPFTLAAQRAAEPFAGMVMAALRAAGADPEMILPEYGAGQWEVLVRPTEGVAAADRAAIVREVVREVARRLGRSVTFSPLPDPDGIGNGVHVHLSLLDDDGLNALYDAGRPGALSALGGAFAAGVLRHLPALLAFTAPSGISFLRLTPHHWSAGTAASATATGSAPCASARSPRWRAATSPGSSTSSTGRWTPPPRRTSAWHCSCAPAWPASAPAWRRRRCSTAIRPSCRTRSSPGSARGRCRPTSTRPCRPWRRTRSCAAGCRTTCGPATAR